MLGDGNTSGSSGGQLSTGTLGLVCNSEYPSLMYLVRQWELLQSYRLLPNWRHEPTTPPARFRLKR